MSRSTEIPAKVLPVWMQTPESVYVHIPFCDHRCGYCNFSLITGRDDLVEPFLEALNVELGQQTRDYPTPIPIRTLFLGGGTPTYLNPAQRERLRDQLSAFFCWQDPQDFEFSLESNPNDLCAEAVEHWRQLGVNRFSLGVQSFQDKKLQRLQRTHRRSHVLDAADLVRGSGADLSLDLIFASPGETQAEWEADLRQAIDCHPAHVSTYQLTFEKGTQFWNLRQRGQLVETEDDRCLTMYRTAIERLEEAGLKHYEVSNFAVPGRESRHNLAYWTGRPYFAFGPAAARYLAGQRYVNHGSTTRYIRQTLAGNDPTREREPYDPELRAREYFVFGMRLMNGIDRSVFHRETGFELESLCGTALQNDLHNGWLRWDNDILRMTPDGLAISDSLWPNYL